MNSISIDKLPCLKNIGTIAAICNADTKEDAITIANFVEYSLKRDDKLYALYNVLTQVLYKMQEP